MTLYVAAGIPARIVRVGNTTLYRVAAEYLGDAMYWTRIALINGLSDPWIFGSLIELKIPKLSDNWLTDGILGSWPEASAVVAAPVASALPQATPTPPAITMEQISALIPYLPTTLPDKPGVLWSNGGLVSIS